MKFTFIDTAHAAPANETEAPTEAHETAAADGGVLGSLGINPTLFGFQLINFAIVAAIVWFVILKPLTSKMTERQKMIDESLANVDKIQEKLAKGERDYQERIDTAKVEANKIIEKAGVQAEQLSESMKIKAREDIEQLVDQAKRNIEVERDQTIQQIKSNTATMIIAAVEKVLSQKLDSAKDQKLVEEMVSKIAYEEEK
jgi:F-type H+-transporting ATPase subunit b